MSVDTTNGNILLCIEVPIPEQRKKFDDLRQSIGINPIRAQKIKIEKYIFVRRIQVPMS